MRKIATIELRCQKPDRMVRPIPTKGQIPYSPCLEVTVKCQGFASDRDVEVSNLSAQNTCSNFTFMCLSWVSGKLPIYPYPKPTLTLTSYLGQNVGLGKG